MPQFFGAVAPVVPDYDEAIAYYTQVLGFELAEDSARRRQTLGAGRAARIARNPSAARARGNAGAARTRRRPDRWPRVPVPAHRRFSARPRRIHRPRRQEKSHHPLGWMRRAILSSSVCALHPRHQRDNLPKRRFIEGSKKLVTHVRTERNQALVREAKREFQKKHGRLFCEGCGFEFAVRYGTRDQDFT